MGYDVHITRADDWLDSESHPITLDEWATFVEQDPEMRMDGHADATVDGDKVLRYENPGLAVWIAYSGHDEAGNKAWFDFRKDRIVVKNPDDEILAKMKQIARQFQANVLGDEGEAY